MSARQQPTTPVVEDAHATTEQLLQRAATDYATAEARREQLAHEDRATQHGGQP